MRILLRHLAALLLLLSMTGCNVFFPTESVELGAPTETTGPSTGEVCTGSSCTCEQDCTELCEGRCELTCEQGATCDVTLDNGGDVRCEEGSDCHVECEQGNCEVECEGSCTLHCGPKAGACGWTTCDGERTQCGARGLACDAECP